MKPQPTPDLPDLQALDDLRRRVYGPQEPIADEAVFADFAAKVVERHDEHLLDDGPEKQAANVVEKLKRFAKQFPVRRVYGEVIRLGGFGEVPVQFTTDAHQYFLLSDAAQQLGWNQAHAADWAEEEFGDDLQDQRRKDEDRGDGRIGWELMDSYVDLGVWLCVPDPEAKPDHYGKRWSFAGDWLINEDRLMSMMSSSPWSQEYVDNVTPLLSHIGRKVLGDKLNTPVLKADGTLGEANGYDLFHTDGLTEEEAVRRANRGPALEE